MGKLSPEEMSKIQRAKEERKKTLETLISNPFNPEDKDQKEAIELYLSEFEYSMNLIYVYQALTLGVPAAALSWMVSFLPFNVFKELSPLFLFIAGVGHVLDKFSASDFSNQLEEMKTIYNWCLKNNNPNYNPAIDNSKILEKSHIQHMIQVLAPLCRTEFLKVWPEESHANKNNQGLMSWITYPATYFYSAPVVNANLQQLKEQVETRAFDLNRYGQAKKAMEYFASHKNQAFSKFLNELKEFIRPWIIPGFSGNDLVDDVVKNIVAAPLK